MDRIPHFRWSLVAALAAACAAEQDSSVDRVTVTNAHAEGRGSLAAALHAANQNHHIQYIDFSSDVDSIVLREPLVFSGPQHLSINGRGAVVDADGLSAGASAFTAERCPNIAIDSLSIRNAPDVGIKIIVPADAADTVVVRLTQVHVAGNAGHGLIVNDQAAYFHNPDSENNRGSKASLHVVITNSAFEKNGFGALDRDGVRLNEGGDGDLRVEIVGSNMEGNGGDGVEIDERGSGSAIIDVQSTALRENGSFSNKDLDDGLDIDEFDAGDVIAAIRGSFAFNNFDQGFDLNESGDGDLRVEWTDVQAIRNRQAGIDLQEYGDGNLSVVGSKIEASENAAPGITAEQIAPGIGTLTITGLVAHGNRVAPVRASGVIVRTQPSGNRLQAL